MNEWQVVSVIVVLIGLLITVITPLIKLNSTLVRLTTLIESNENRNNSEHCTMRQDICKHEKQLEDHEHRITILEQQ